MICETPPINDPEATSVQEPIDVEKLGRQRPPAFSTIWTEIGFIIALLGSMAMAEFFVSGFHIILPPLAIELDIPEASRTWPSSVFSLVTGSFLLPLGRVSDMYGAHVVFASGLGWFCLWSLVAGFSQNYMTLIICRAFQGLGSAAFLPSGVSLLGKIYRPGPRKNLVFALYGAFAPLGFFIGILMGGVSGEFLSWRWYFWLGSIVLAIICCFAILCVPRDFRRHPPSGVSMDWWGALTIVPGLVLVVYAITDSSHAPNGWASPQIIVTIIAGVFLLATAIYIEGWVVKDPLLPADLFSPAYMKPLVVALFFAYGSYGLFLFYTSFYIELVLHKSPLQTALWYVPLIVGGLLSCYRWGGLLFISCQAGCYLSFPGSAMLSAACSLPSCPITQTTGPGLCRRWFHRRSESTSRSQLVMYLSRQTSLPNDRV
ncbi:hypothetical protein FALCPG4_015257 [Fusarium falciforme]